MTPAQQFAQECLDFLDGFLRDAYEHRVESLRTAFLYRHGSNIHFLGDDALELDVMNRLAGASVLIRPMFESLFCILAAVARPSFAVEKMIAEFEEDAKRMRKWIASVDLEAECAAEMTNTVNRLESFAQKYRVEHNATSGRKWNVLETANEAGVSIRYVRDYFYFSGFIHASTRGIVFEECGDSRLLLLQAICHITLEAAGNIAQVLPSSDPQSFVDRATHRLGRLLDHVNAGMFQNG